MGAGAGAQARGWVGAWKRVWRAPQTPQPVQCHCCLIDGCGTLRARLPRCGGGAGAVQTLGISGDPSGDNGNPREASRKEQKLPGSLWDYLFVYCLLSIGKHKKILGRQVLCWHLSSGVLWAVWGVHLGMMHWCLATDRCHSADAVRVQCSSTLIAWHWMACHAPMPWACKVRWCASRRAPRSGPMQRVMARAMPCSYVCHTPSARQARHARHAPCSSPKQGVF